MTPCTELSDSEIQDPDEHLTPKDPYSAASLALNRREFLAATGLLSTGLAAGVAPSASAQTSPANTVPPHPLHQQTIPHPHRRHPHLTA